MSGLGHFALRLPEHYKPMILAIESSGMKISADSVKSKLLQEVKSENNNSAFASAHSYQTKNVKRSSTKVLDVFNITENGGQVKFDSKGCVILNRQNVIVAATKVNNMYRLNMNTGAGIRHQTTTPYTPEQNGAAERLNRTLVERAKCMILNAGLAKFFWAEAIKTAAYIINRSPTRSLSFKTPEEVWSGHKPNVSHMKVFGCEAMVHLPKEKRKKWDPKAQKMIFIGYCENTKGYRFIIPNTRTVIKSRDAVFLESTVKRNYAALELSEKENKTLDIQCKSNEESLMSNQSNEENREETYNSDSSYNTIKNNSDSDEYLPDVKIDTPSQAT
ncbi:Retrovirus-related Pol polyprotein from transposon TNT 1-94 [Eumeta japonica]|uniref:Retrovirus-related Pol polyprotein from transposon TNT 1-94 n=1 Tax=Eumeta variegata TaxID=151549 RepID=A0A4C1Y7Y6_EUMVA|nr:Retrovirus-related Pol polyprotein from transposon TNT 1-94 [Eumeta japonica]